MPFSIGTTEILLILACAAPTLALYLRGHWLSHFAIVATACLTLASILTPADPLSALLFAAAFFGVYLIGSRHRASEGY